LTGFNPTGNLCWHVFLENTSENLGEMGKTAEIYEMKLEERKCIPMSEDIGCLVRYIKMQTVHSFLSCHVLPDFVMLGAANVFGLVIMYLLVKDNNVCGRKKS